MAQLTTDERRAWRRKILDISLRKQKPGSGSTLTMEREPRAVWLDLTGVLRGIPWAIVGAVAAREYARERRTGALDIAVMREPGAKAAERLEAAGLMRTGELPFAGTVWHTRERVAVHVLEVDGEWWPAALAAAASNTDARGAPVLPLKYLVLMKLASGRLWDASNLTEILGRANERQLNEVRDLVRRHSPADFEDLESLIMLGKLEFGEAARG